MFGVHHDDFSAPMGKRKAESEATAKAAVEAIVPCSLTILIGLPDCISLRSTMNHDAWQPRAESESGA